jgi:hypothetical protein
MTNGSTDAICPARAPSPTRLGIVAGLLLIASLSLTIIDPLSDTPVASLASWPMWCVVAWVGMQGAGRWRAVLGGIAFGGLMVLITTLAMKQFRPDLFGTWDTVWSLDVPAMALSLLKSWSLFRLGSLITGVEITDPTVPSPHRWSLRSWLMLMVALAVFFQSSLSEMNWYSELSGDPTPSQAVGPPAEPPMAKMRWEWLLFLSAGLPEIPVLPCLFMGWILAKGKWRWAALPFLVAVLLGTHYWMFHAMQWLRLEYYWVRALGLGDKQSWLWGGIADCIAYGLSALLIPWMGYAWSSYGSRDRAVAPSRPSMDDGVVPMEQAL